MAQIVETENLKAKIISHRHYNDKCLPEYIVNDFSENVYKIGFFRHLFDELKNTERDIIKLQLDKKNIEQELNNLKIVIDKDLNNEKIKLNNMEEMYIKEKENNLLKIKNEYNNSELKSNYDVEILDKEIENLKKEIQLKEEALKIEIDYKKQEELFKLKNEFKIKLIQYINTKKLEKQIKEKENEIRQKKFESDKEIEFNELKQKSLLVQKIISTIKNISLNN